MQWQALCECGDRLQRVRRKDGNENYSVSSSPGRSSFLRSFPVPLTVSVTAL